MLSKPVPSHAITAITLAVILLSYSNAAAQEFWVFPKQNQQPAAPNPAPLRDACLHPSQWPTGWNRMTWFGNSIQYWEAWRQSSPAEVSQCFANLRNANKTVVIELGALKPHCQTGQACFNQVLPILASLVGLGMPTDQLYLAIDEPLTTGHPNFRFGNGGPYADFSTAVAETVNFIAAARAYGPIKFILHEAYPTHSPTTLFHFASAVHYGALGRTGLGLQYLNLDWDWNDDRGQPLTYHLNSIGQLKAAVAGIGVKFSLLFWNNTGSRTWEEGLIHQATAVRNSGLNPDAYAVLSFTDATPSQTLPEWTPGTFMRSIREFANVFLPRPTSAFGLTANGVLWPGEWRASPDNRFRLVYQTDGNLVLYRTHDPGNTASWQWLFQTYTNIQMPGGVWMQGSDGNLVVYNYSPNTGYFPSSFATSTTGNAGAYLMVQSDGNLVIYRGLTAIWQRPGFKSGIY